MCSVAEVIGTLCVCQIRLSHLLVIGVAAVRGQRGSSQKSNPLRFLPSGGASLCGKQLFSRLLFFFFLPRLLLLLPVSRFACRMTKRLRATDVNTTGFLRISVETNKTKKCSRDACLGSFSNFRLRPPTSRESIAYYSNRMTPGDIHPDSICIDEKCIYLLYFFLLTASSFVVTVVFGTW